jgi:transposase InsO family protein
MRRGRRHGHKQAAPLMRRAGIPREDTQAVEEDHYAGPAAKSWADRIRRTFTADAVKLNTRWSGDITYIGTWEGWLYLATAIGIASRCIVGYALADHLLTELVTVALGWFCSRTPTALVRELRPRPRPGGVDVRQF